MKLQSLLTAVGLSCLFSGCIMVNLPEVKPVRTVSYSLNLSQKRVSAGFPLEIGFFRSEVPTKFKMAVRDGTELRTVPFAKWTLPPAALVHSAFEQLFHPRPEDSLDGCPVLEGNVLMFEKTVGDNQVSLHVQYQLLDPKLKRILYEKCLTASVKAKNDSAEAYAEAMSEAVYTQAVTLAKELKTVKETEKK